MARHGPVLDLGWTVSDVDHPWDPALHVALERVKLFV
jgi:hypothetical protein